MLSMQSEKTSTVPRLCSVETPASQRNKLCTTCDELLRSARSPDSEVPPTGTSSVYCVVAETSV